MDLVKRYKMKGIFLVIVFYTLFALNQTTSSQIQNDDALPDILRTEILTSEDDIFWSEDFITPIWRNPDVSAVVSFGNRIFTAENGKVITYQYKTNSWNVIGTVGSGMIYAMAYYDTLIYVGGSFEVMEGKRVNFIASWNGTQWSDIGQGLDRRVYTLAVDDEGIVYAGGEFNFSINNDTLNYFAFWDGSKWKSPAEQPDGYVRAIWIKGDSIIIGGEFEMIGEKEFLKIAVWDKKQEKWFPLGNGIQSGRSEKVIAITSDASGNIYAGGMFLYAGDVAASNIAVFDGNKWNDMKGGVLGIVRALASVEDRVYVGGSFSNAGGKNIERIAYWDNNDWHSLKGGVQGSEYPSVATICRNGKNSILVGGNFNLAGDISCNGLALWNGSDWLDLFSGKRNGVVSIVYDLSIDDNNLLYAGGAFVKTGDKTSKGLSIWDGNYWIGCNKGLDPPAVVYSIKPLGSDIYFTGWFFGADSVKLNNVAKWLGKEKKWEPIGPGIDGGDGVLGPILISGNEIFVGGRFKTAGDATVNHITYWDGTKWNDMDGGINNQNASISTIVDAGNGHIYITGSFDTVGKVRTPYFAVWDKNLKKWIEPPLRFNGIPHSILIDNDSVYFGGSFTNVSGVEVRNLVLWDRKKDVLYNLTNTDGAVRTIFKWFDDIYVGGLFRSSGNKTVNSIFKYNLKTGEVEPLGSGIKQGLNFGRVLKILVYKNALYVAGMFTNAGNKLSSNFAKWTKIKTDVPNISLNRNNFKSYICSNNILSIKLEQNCVLNKIEVFNYLGQIVRVYNSNEITYDGTSIIMNLGEIISGFYIINFSYETKNDIIKLIKY